MVGNIKDSTFISVHLIHIPEPVGRERELEIVLHFLHQFVKTFKRIIALTTSDKREENSIQEG